MIRKFSCFSEKDQDDKTIADALLTIRLGEELSAKELSDVISLLQKKRQAEEEKEKQEREERERRRHQKQEEKERKWRLELEKKERQAEHVRQVTSMELPLDWDNAFCNDEETKQVHVDSIADGLIKCLNRFARVDIEYVSAITGADCKTVIETLKGSIYQNPDTWKECFYKGWETAEEYLSGNIMEKLKVAVEKNEIYHGYFEDNVVALKEVLPRGLSSDKIYVTLGSPWVPEKYVNEFADFITRNRSRYQRFVMNENTGTWELTKSYKNSNEPTIDNNYQVMEEYGIGRMSPVRVMLKTLNMQSIVIYDSNKGYGNAANRTVNQSETIVAREKQEKLINKFKEWIWADPERRRSLETLYAQKYLSNKVRHFDGSFLELPGLNPGVLLYQYQKNAIARILFTQNTLLAHEVGSGKTYIMIVAGMELKRLKLSKKNMYVVPGNLLGQWRDMFELLYPQANVFYADADKFTPKRIHESLKRMRDGNYDAIVVAYGCFTRMEISKQERESDLQHRIDRLEQFDDDKTQKMVKNLKGKLDKVLLEMPSGEICFDELGVTRLFVDEIHNFKNIPIETDIEYVLGINKNGSAKCSDMLDKIRIVQRQDGGGVILATGTPITNSITDVFVIQQYLQSEQLELLDIGHFDNWVAMFAQKSMDFEIDVDTSKYRLATRFSKFHNIPELTNILATVADFHQMDATADVPVLDGYEDVRIRKTKDFSNFLKEISERADDVRAGIVSRKEDNMLMITTDGRKGALDMRLVNPDAKFTTSSKVFQCAESVAGIYKETAADKSTQLVLCDSSVPRNGFNMYDEMRRLLVKMGVRDQEIAYVHDATTEKKREELFENVRNGIVRVLIGSTFKLGMGVNVQDRLIALHHLDMPWRPADMVQREGRILRQGNLNAKVRVFRYVTEGSFDAYSWQLLETKQRFITAILSGSIEDRSGSDVDDVVLSYAEIKALAVGNPLIRERVNVANELTRLTVLQQNKMQKMEGYRKDVPILEEDVKRRRELMVEIASDAEFYERHKKKYEPEKRKLIGEKILEALNVDEPRQDAAFITRYQGFNIIVPEKASKFFRVVRISRTGNYQCNVSLSVMGVMQSIDYILGELCERLLANKKQLESALKKIEFMRSELGKADEDYVNQIEECREKLGEIDKRLHV